MTLVKFNKPTNGNSNLRSYSPLNSLFEDFWDENLFGGRSVSRVPDVNISESEDHYTLEMALPGYTKDQLNVKIEDDVLTISSVVESEAQNEGTFLKREFNFSSFKRSFTLNETMDAEKVHAEMKNGILKLTLPKKEEAKPQIKEIKIS